MRFTEHELTMAVQGAAKAVLAAQDKDVRRGRVDVEQKWKELAGYARYQLIDGVGTQVLPVLLALPDIEVAAGEKPTFTDQQVEHAIAETAGEGGGGRFRRKVETAARAMLVKQALASLPPRQDPDALIVPDHL
jgi:hypothetical protein